MTTIEPLLKKKQVAEILQIDERTVDQYRADGIIQTCNIPAVRFEPNHIRELMGVKLEKFSPLERRRLERELEDLKQENAMLKGIIAKIQSMTAEAIYSSSNDT
ncbi:histidine kinase [Clostridium kluyveri]|uniref:Histidine kinase n=2 Tax=Clostridium kluyveri TaxID=1534 RepID=A5N1G9_CLOK5|nr:histidine kinase [Clostridium kluyveri]EDK34965.1 Hypothetical protein CKL_2956 [Clostridium kluyveri DSM 555]BAH07667.1 hypothetical protein CKR_2616 [Clostridium kluyveri NBRC 12016]